MTTFLSGGTGTPKLLAGMDRDDAAGRDGSAEPDGPSEPDGPAEPDDVTVIANTGDDVELGGHLVSPDLDTLLFLYGGILDRETWWGIDGDTAETHDHLQSLAGGAGLDSGPRYLDDDAQVAGRRISRWRRFSGVGEFMHIGDRDRAVHITRTGLLDEGRTLTEATSVLADALGCSVSPLPMSDDPVATIVHTAEGEMHFQEFWVARGGDPEIEDVEFRGAEEARPSGAVLDALDDPVVVGPSNPVTSIGPMLALDGVREALRETTVVAVSPFVEDRVFSGPAGDLMAAIGYEPSTRGVADAYPFADAFVLDEADGTDLDRPVVRTDTRIDDERDAARVRAACGRALSIARPEPR